MSWAHGYRKKDPKRVCDICGVLMFFSELKYIGQNRWACSDDAPGLTEYQISKHNARVKPLLVRQVKHPRSLAQTPTYLSSEALNFSLVRDQWRTRNNVSALGAGAVDTGSVSRAGLAGLYFGELLAEGERPTSWLTQAAVQLRATADFILANQYGSPTGQGAYPSEPTNSILYGMVISPSGTFAISVDQAKCGLSLLRAYQYLGDTKYLDGANRVATCFRQGFQQRQSGVAAVNPTDLYVGGFADDNNTVKGISGFYSINGAAGMWFLAQLRAVVGGSKVYGLTTSGGDFTAAPAGTLDTMLAEARTFYAGGKLSGFLSPTMTGAIGPVSILSVATPRDYYGSSPFTGPASFGATFSAGQYVISSTNLAYALRGLFEYEGYSATVAGSYEWLMSCTTDPSSLPPAGASMYTIANGQLGTYDPNVAIAATLAYGNSTGAPIALTSAGDVAYATFVAGMLAPVRIASGRDLSVTKAALASARRIQASHTDTNDQFAYPSLRGFCGLSFQMGPFVGGAGQFWATTNNAALCGLVYRYAPKATPGVRTPS